MTEPDVLRRHAFHHLLVKQVVQETADTRSLVIEVPDELRETFRYQPGQFCSFRIHVGDVEHTRCYSMSSAPETDPDLTVTVKRVPGGVVSNWLNDHVAAGDRLEVSRPAGSFCPRPGERPVIGFCGGSGVTPVLSILKSTLATSDRPVRVLYANRDRGSIIFDDALAALTAGHPDRFVLRHHLDTAGGFVDAAAITAFVDGCTDADFYICGPGPFMDLVEATLLDLGAEPDAVFIERFVNAGSPAAATDGPTEARTGEPTAQLDATGPGAGVPEHLVLILRGKKHEIPYRAGDTVLETARRANLNAPYSCEAGSCATCMALLRDGAVRMRCNDALTDDEVAEGWVLTCQSEPTSPTFTVEYEPL